MPVITIGTAGTTWGLAAETGMLVQSFTAKTSREKNSVRDAAGDIVAVAFYNPTQTISLSGVTTGALTASPAAGVALTVANSTASANGMNAGLIYVDDVEISKANTEFQKISVNATRYLAITS